MRTVRELITLASLRGPHFTSDATPEESDLLRTWVREHGPHNPHTAYIERFYTPEFTQALQEAARPDLHDDIHPYWHTWDGTLPSQPGYTPPTYTPPTPEHTEPEPTTTHRDGMSLAEALDIFHQVRREQRRRRRIALLKLLAIITATIATYFVLLALDIL